MAQLKAVNDKELLFHARPQHYEHHADSEERDRNRGRDLRGFLFVYGGFYGTDLRDFFLFVIGEIGVDESNYTKNQKYGYQNNHDALHRPETYHNDWRLR